MTLMERLGSGNSVIRSIGLILGLFLAVYCGMDVTLNLSSNDIQFVSPSEDTFYNKYEFPFELKMTSANRLLSLADARVYLLSVLPTPVSWIVDTTPPVLTLSSVPEDYVNTTAQSVAFNATDENDIDYYECVLNGASWANCNSPFNFTAVVDTNIAAVRAFDPAGNHHELTTSFLVDVEPPVLTFADTPDVITASSDATFTWAGTDPGDSGIETEECSLNG